MILTLESPCGPRAFRVLKCVFCSTLKADAGVAPLEDVGIPPVAEIDIFRSDAPGDEVLIRHEFEVAVRFGAAACSLPDGGIAVTAEVECPNALLVLASVRNRNAISSSRSSAIHSRVGGTASCA